MLQHAVSFGVIKMMIGKDALLSSLELQTAISSSCFQKGTNTNALENRPLLHLIVMHWQYPNRSADAYEVSRSKERICLQHKAIKAEG